MVFSFNNSFSPAGVPVRATTNQTAASTLDRTKEPRALAPVTLNVPATSSFSVPRPGDKHDVIGAQRRVVKPLPKSRVSAKAPVHAPLLKAAPPGTAVSSDEGGSSGDDVILYKCTSRYDSHFDRHSRYIPRVTYKAGDHVLVNVCDGPRSVWRHGVIADFEEWPPLNESNGYLKLYAVTYEVVPDLKRTLYFSPRGCSILYDRLLSNPESEARERWWAHKA
ncbi:hypothetical protein OH77DRAFT_1105148 [Trametes cingulata]|nr:hypothetical protein OH77DRAFT_1105148 [Trametes cingulata]